MTGSLVYYKSMGSQRIRHGLATGLEQLTKAHIEFKP